MLGIYMISTGVLSLLAPMDETNNERVVYEAFGYAGRHACKNNPECTAKRGEGPLPVGFYRVLYCSDHRRLGADVFKLEPFQTNEMFGRSGFWIHGDSRERPGDASHGCIVLPHSSRIALEAYGLSRLEVVPGSVALATGTRITA